jgi:hypothetical protein
MALAETKKATASSLNWASKLSARANAQGKMLRGDDKFIEKSLRSSPWARHSPKMYFIYGNRAPGSCYTEHAADLSKRAIP